MNLLIIGSVWPEPISSAAGENMMNIITQGLNRNWQITFASAASASPHAADIASMGVDVRAIQLNHSSFDAFVEDIQPDIVIFDRFMTEEQFSWRVAQGAPNALRVLNTEDCHSLRTLRQKNKRTDDSLSQQEIVIREASSILRSDLSLIVSKEEIEWLHNYCSVPLSQLIHSPLFIKSKTPELKAFSKTRHISFIGNFRHGPNWDAVLKLRQLWPKIREKIGSDEECHIFGAYPPKKATELSNEKLGFFVKGWIKDADQAFIPYRLAVAPLQFGAGVKGKLLRAIHCLTPSITTPIGVEGIELNTAWPGIVAEDDDSIVDAAATLYNNQNEWEVARDKAISAHFSLSKKDDNLSAVFDQLEYLQKNIIKHREQHFLLNVLNYQTVRSNQYMSQWIEAKNKLLS